MLHTHVPKAQQILDLPYYAGVNVQCMYYAVHGCEYQRMEKRESEAEGLEKARPSSFRAVL